VPASISEAVLAKKKGGGAGAPRGATAAPDRNA
jgi:hypothetical protein